MMDAKNQRYVDTVEFSTPDGYVLYGTSASAPHVAGMAALLLDANPSASRSDTAKH